MGGNNEPIFTDLIVRLGVQRKEASERADLLARLLADLETLHEPDADGECPTCLVEAPCLTLRVVHREITVDQAVAHVRDHQVMDLDAATRPHPPVPSLKELLATASPGVDRFFEALLGTPPAPGRRSA